MKSFQLFLILIVLLLSVLAMVVRNPKDRPHTVVDVAELARTIEQEDDHITVEELAAELISHKTHWQIIDLRDSLSFTQYHIPGAVRAELTTFVVEQLIKEDTVLLYSDGGLHAIQAWMLLRARGYTNVFSLKGGIQEWNETIRFPRLNDSLSVEQKSAISARAAFFGGRVEEGNVTQPVEKPQNRQKKEKRQEIKVPREEEKLRNEC